MRDLRLTGREYAPREGWRTLLAWRRIGRSAPFHATPSSGCRSVPLRSVRGALVNSEERRAARRARREEKRTRKKAERTENLTLETVADLNNLYRASKQAAKGVNWKASVQNYHIHLLRNLSAAHEDLVNGRDIRRGFIRFDLWERGKLRHIAAVHFSERVIHKSLSQNALVPAIAPSLVGSNTANLKGRGTDYAIQLMRLQLARHWRKHGSEGYILQVDFSDYFASIAHDPVKEIVRDSLSDQRLVNLTEQLIDSQGEVGLGLGSEPNQILAVSLPSSIDHFVQEMCYVEAYGRYMDDLYCIHTDKEWLHIVLELIEWKCRQLGITINRKKTRIVKLSHGFTFLKKKFSYSPTGRIVVRPSRDAITRQRRKLKKLKALYDAGEMTLEDVSQSYQSWRGSFVNRSKTKGSNHARVDAQRTVESMDRLYKQLFSPENVAGGGPFIAFTLKRAA